VALQQDFSHPKSLVYWFQAPPKNMKSQNQLIANHLDQSIYVTNQEHMLNCALTVARLSILSKNVEPTSSKPLGPINIFDESRAHVKLCSDVC
jgi:hypothetical protein